MPAPARLITVNLGSQTIGLAEFRAAHGNLVLVNYRLREAPLDPETGQRRDAHTALQETGAVLGEMMREMQIHRDEVNYAVPAQSVFARFVKLPALDASKVDKIIEFEAQQNIPFPIDEVVWDYQLVGGGMGEEIQVVIVAIKRDLLEEINNAVEQTGLRTRTVDMASMALYNAFRFSYPDTGDCSLLLDIGARTTNILFIEPGRFFLRSIPLGGSAITAAIAREFKESFAAAEERKKRDGFVGLGGAYAEPADPDVARVSKIARSTMTRLHAELMRSVTHYRAQQQGNRPARIFLCGGAGGMPYMREFFHEKFQVPIEFFNPLQRVTVSESAPMQDVAHSAHLLGEMVGLALRNETICPVELNLPPASVLTRQDLEKRRPFFIAAAACILIALLGWSFYYTRAAQVAQKTAEIIRQRNDTMRVAEGQLDKLKKQITALDNTATPLITAVDDRNFWPQILEQLNSRLPESDIWITELAATSGGKLLGLPEKRAAELVQTLPPAPAIKSASTAKNVIDGINVHGLYLYNPKQQEIVVDYLRNLSKSPLFAIDARTPERFIKSNSVPNDTEWAFPYELQLALKKPAKMP
jgi:type IV pilus assembly protein PilM